MLLPVYFLAQTAMTPHDFAYATALGHATVWVLGARDNTLARTQPHVP